MKKFQAPKAKQAPKFQVSKITREKKFTTFSKGKRRTPFKG